MPVETEIALSDARVVDPSLRSQFHGATQLGRDRTRLHKEWRFVIAQAHEIEQQLFSTRALQDDVVIGGGRLQLSRRDMRAPGGHQQGQNQADDLTSPRRH